MEKIKKTTKKAVEKKQPAKKEERKPDPKVFDRIIDALERNLGIVTIACKEINFGRRTFYVYMQKYPEFKARVEDINNITLDFVESKLLSNIKAGDTTAIIYYLNCKGLTRGYMARQKVEHSGEVKQQLTFVEKLEE